MTARVAHEISTRFARRLRVDGECVHGACQFVRQRCIYHAVTLDPALPLEGFGHDINAEMRLAARPVAGVAFVQMRFVLNLDAFR